MSEGRERGARRRAPSLHGPTPQSSNDLAGRPAASPAWRGQPGCTSAGEVVARNTASGGPDPPCFPLRRSPCPVPRGGRHARPSLARRCPRAATERHCRRRASHSSAAAGRAGVCQVRQRAALSRQREKHREKTGMSAAVRCWLCCAGRPVSRRRRTGRYRVRGGRGGAVSGEWRGRTVAGTAASTGRSGRDAPSGACRAHMPGSRPRRGMAPATAADQCRTCRYVAMVRRARPGERGVCPANRRGK